jgi:putative endonuclease
MMATNDAVGRWAESCAKWWMRLKGYHIVAHRYKTPFGEIDFIARRGRTLVAVEVKYRKTQEIALEAVHPRQQKRIYDAFTYFQTTLKWHPKTYRFDVICICPWRFPLHIVNAWV